jgi:hypothetical protein
MGEDPSLKETVTSMACTELRDFGALLKMVEPFVPEEKTGEVLLAANAALCEVNNLGYQRGIEAAVQALMAQYRGCQPGTLVSYHIAADVLSVELLGKRAKE